jgi:hypothetical protein
MVGRGTVAGDRAEDLKLGLVEGSADLPARPRGHEVGEMGSRRGFWRAIWLTAKIFCSHVR